jgi:O-antigen/teichoic acid export membrane protein
VLARSLAGPFQISLRSPSWIWFRRLFSFGLKLHVSSTCAIVNRQLDKLLLGRWAGLPAVASYEIGLRVAANAGSFQPYLAAALLPAASHLHARGEGVRLVEMYERASRYLFLVGVPLFVFIMMNSSDLVTAWLGRPHPMASTVLRLLAVGYMVNSLSNAMAFVCQGIGRPDIQAWQSAFQLVANIVLSVFLYHLIGPLGPPLGTSLAFILGAWLFAAKFHPVLGISTLRVLRYAAVAPVIASVLAAAAGWAVAAGLQTTGRLEAALGLSLTGAVFAAVYLCGCLVIGVLGREELDVLRSLISGGRGGTED